MQQLLLRWNQGQDLRQALITIAVSLIVADQVIAHFPRHVPEGTKAFGGNAVGIGWPGWTNRLVDLHIWDVQYSLARLVMLALGAAVGVALWLWLYRTKTGMVIRAGVDDRQMTSAIGINIQVTFAIAFAVGAALVALGATVGTSQGNISQGQDGVWLLNSLVVVIIGGMGSLVGAVAGSLLFGLVTAFSDDVPARVRPGLLHAVLDRADVRAAWRSCSPSARAGCSGEPHELERKKLVVERGIGIGVLVFVLVAPRSSQAYWMDAILTPDAHPRDRRREPRLPLRVRRHDLARAGRPDGHRGLSCSATWSRAREGGDTKGLLLGWDPTVAVVVAILLTVGIGILFGAVASRELRDLLPDDHADVLGDRVPVRRPGDPGRRVLAGSAASTSTRRGSWATSSTTANASTTSRSAVALVVYAVIRYLVRTPFGIALAGDPRRAGADGSLGYNVHAAPHARVRLRRRSSRRSAVCSSPGGRGSSRRPTSASRRRSTSW